MNRLSGDQNGNVPPSVPGIGRAARAATGRSQIWYAGWRAGDEHDVPAIRRHRHLCGAAGASAQQDLQTTCSLAARW